jgi:ATP-binding cassette, subfamily B, bacterial
VNTSLSSSKAERGERSVLASVARVAPYFRARLGTVVTVFLLSAAGAALSALEPLAMREVFDSFAANKQLARTFTPFLALLGLLLGGELLGMLREYVVWRVRLHVDYALLHDSVERLHALPLSYHTEQSVGATMQKIERGIAGTVTTFHDVVVRLFPALIYLVVSVVIMLRLEWRLALAVVALAPLPALLGAWAAKEQLRREQGLLERWTRLFGRLNEVLSSMLAVKSFAMEDREKRRFLGGIRESNGIVLRGVVRDARTNSGKNVLMLLARFVALGLGAKFVMDGDITIGTLVAFVGYLGGAFGPVQALTGMFQSVKRATASFDLVLSILDTRNTLTDAPDAREAGPLRGAVEFDGVSFRYQSGREVLRDVSLRVHPGEMIAFVGPSGSGKSTLMALLQRLHDPSSGVVKVDGVDVRRFTQRSLRQRIAVVLQDPALFSDTVGENIALGRPGASSEQIEAAARAANAHEFITSFPEGYDTLLGERGAKLSGGERQRLAIARALLRDAPILILDEATSALDAATEERVQEALATLVQGRTTFVIAHRLATVRSADRIAVLRDGVIVELGTHEQLLRANGLYADLVDTQFAKTDNVNAA